MLIGKVPEAVGVPTSVSVPEAPAAKVQGEALQVAVIPTGKPSSARVVEVTLNGKDWPEIAPANDWNCAGKALATTDPLIVETAGTIKLMV